MILVGSPVRPADRVEVKAALGRLTLTEGHVTTLNAERVSPARTAAAGAAGICEHKKDNYQNNESCEGNVSGNTGSDVTCIPTMTSYLHHQ